MPNQMDSLVAKVAGKAGALEARLRGLSGVFRVLAEQHHAVLWLLSRTEGARSYEERRELWNELRRELISHEHAELIEVYPALLAYHATKEAARIHGQQAAELEGLIGALDATSVHSDAWLPTFDDLARRVRAHVDTEESEVFPRAQEVLGDEAARRLQGPMLAAKQDAMNRFT
jgi:hypothetical protein